MKLPKRIAKRYARAIADVAIARGETEKVKDELKRFAEIFAPGSPAHRALTAPNVPKAEKRAALEAVLWRAKPLETTANALRVLLKNRRFGHLAEILEAFEEEIDRRRGFVPAKIETARDLDDSLRREVIAALEKASGYRLRPVWKPAPELIGGFRANVAGTVFDASVKGRLEALRERLLAEAFKPDRQSFAKQPEKPVFV